MKPEDDFSIDDLAIRWIVNTPIASVRDVLNLKTLKGSWLKASTVIRILQATETRLRHLTGDSVGNLTCVISRDLTQIAIAESTKAQKSLLHRTYFHPTDAVVEPDSCTTPSNDPDDAVTQLQSSAIDLASKIHSHFGEGEMIYAEDFFASLNTSPDQLLTMNTLKQGGSALLALHSDSGTHTIGGHRRFPRQLVSRAKYRVRLESLVEHHLFQAIGRVVNVASYDGSDERNFCQAMAWKTPIQIDSHASPDKGLFEIAVSARIPVDAVVGVVIDTTSQYIVRLIFDHLADRKKFQSDLLRFAQQLDTETPAMDGSSASASTIFTTTAKQDEIVMPDQPNEST